MSAYTLSPGFLNGPSGRLFCLHYKPQQNGAAPRPVIIHVPALTEEMNKSRRMVALQARQFASDGYSVYVFDLHGTGDSDGELEDVSWERWQQDLVFLCDHVQTQEAKGVWLWGLRGGCLLASDCLQHPNVIGGLFWQPTRDGRQVVSQLQRLQCLASNNQYNAVENAQSSLGGEVSGYTFCQRLLEQLSNVSLIENDNFGAKPLILIDVSILQKKSVKGSANSLCDALLQRGGKVDATTVSGVPFWLTPEVALAPNLLIETSRLFELAQVK